MATMRHSWGHGRIALRTRYNARCLQEFAIRPGRLLIVDDEPLLLRALTRALRKQYDVITHTSAVEALDLLASGEPCDLVLADVTMPEMTGFEFAARVARARADLVHRIVLMTGGAYTSEAVAAMEECGLPVIRKPVELDALRALLESICPVPAQRLPAEVGEHGQRQVGLPVTVGSPFRFHRR
jgi:DNA-binding NtrC family response regulator